MKWFLTFMIFLSFGFVISAKESIPNDEIRSGDSLPTFSVLSNTGKAVSTSSLKGKPTLIVFFHTKCLDCRKELPILQQIYDEYRDKVEFIAISRAQPASEIEGFWKVNQLSLPYAAQDDKSVFHLFARKTIPRVYLCDKEGIVIKTFKERIKKKKIIRAINQMLNIEK